MKKRLDLEGNEPKLGDKVAYTPPGYTRLAVGQVIGFKRTSGLPILKTIIEHKVYWSDEVSIIKWDYTPRRGFVVIK